MGIVRIPQLGLKRYGLVLAAMAICSADAPAQNTGVPIGGFIPFLGMALTDEFVDDIDFFAYPSNGPGGNFLGANGAHYDLGLLDTGAAVSLVTSAADDAFGLGESRPGESDGFRGTATLTLGGATGFLQATVGDPLGLYVGGLQGRGDGPNFTMPNDSLIGQTNTSILTIPPESDLPNIIGLPLASQYAIHIRNDQPQIFEKDGRTVRTPAVSFLERGTGEDVGITRRAPMQVNPGASFQQSPFYFLNLDNFDIDKPYEDPSQPTFIQGGLFLDVDLANNGETLEDSTFFFDTGASVTVISEAIALSLGVDPVLTEPDFTVAIVGSGGVTEDVPGFIIDQFTIPALGGSISATNVPVIVLNVTDVSDPGNVVNGIVGTNMLAGRNVVIDPDPALGGGNNGPQLYISDPVTSDFNWADASPSDDWSLGTTWDRGGAPDQLGIANVRHVTGGDQRAVLSQDASIWELHVSGGNNGETMSVVIEQGAELVTFSGTNIEAGGAVELHDGTLDTSFLAIFGGRLAGAGEIRAGTGPILGQVENRTGVVAPGNGIGTLDILGRFVNGSAATMEFELGGTLPTVEYDQVIVEGTAALAGDLQVALADGFLPSAGDKFTLISATEGVGGRFDLLDLPGGINWNITYGLNEVVLEALSQLLGGDLNGDGTINFGDLAPFVLALTDSAAYDAAFPDLDRVARCDVNTDGICNFGDLQPFVDTFSGRAAAATASSSIPEPSGMLLLLLAVVSRLAVRLRA